MDKYSLRSVLRCSLGRAAATALSTPFIANAAATTATVWINQGFVKAEDEAFKQLAADYMKTSGNTLDFSFSGLKTAVLRWFEARELTAEVAARRALINPTLEDWLRVTPKETLDVLASFQATVIEELLKRAVRSADEIDARSLIISGGVACNSGLRAAAEKRRLAYPVFFPTKSLSTDNAAMIAAAGLRRFRAGFDAQVDINAEASLAL